MQRSRYSETRENIEGALRIIFHDISPIIMFYDPWCFCSPALFPKKRIGKFTISFLCNKFAYLTKDNLWEFSRLNK